MSGQNRKEPTRKNSSSSPPVHTKPYYSFRPKGLDAKKDDFKCNPKYVGRVHHNTYTMLNQTNNQDVKNKKSETDSPRGNGERKS